MLSSFLGPTTWQSPPDTHQPLVCLCRGNGVRIVSRCRVCCSPRWTCLFRRAPLDNFNRDCVTLASPTVHPAANRLLVFQSPFFLLLPFCAKRQKKKKNRNRKNTHDTWTDCMAENSYLRFNSLQLYTFFLPAPSSHWIGGFEMCNGNFRVKSRWLLFEGTRCSEVEQKSRKYSVAFFFSLTKKK